MSESKNRMPIDSPKDISIHTQLNAFEFQNVIQAMNVLIPNDVVIALYARAGLQGDERSRDIDPKDGGPTLSISQINDFLDTSIGYDDDLSFFTVCKALATDEEFLFSSFLWFIAGALLTIGACGSALDTIPSEARKNLGLLALLCYFVPGMKYCFGFPVQEYRAKVASEELTLQFRDKMLKNAALHAKMKDQSEHINPSSKGVSLSSQSTFVQLLVYIEEKIFHGDPTSTMTKRDLELLLLRELGSSFNSRLLDDMMLIVDKDNQGTISPAELHHFLASEKIRLGVSSRVIGTGSKFDCVSRTFDVLKSLSANFMYLMTFCFFLGTTISTLKNILGRSGDDLSFIFGRHSPSAVAAWFSFFGTISFTQMAVEWLAKDFDRDAQVKEVLASCVRYASYYHRDDPIWIKYNANNGLDKQSMGRILEESYIILSEGELNGLFHAIDTDNNGVLSKDEIEGHLGVEKNRNVEIFFMCLRSWNFWANFIWLIGSVFYLIPNYAEDPLLQKWCYIFGALGYWIGSWGCLVMAYESKLGSMSVLVRLNEGVDLLMENKVEMGDLRKQMHKFKSDIFHSPEDDGFDEESQLDRGDAAALSLSKRAIDTDPFASFLSRLISCDEEVGTKEFMVEGHNQEFMSLLESSSTCTTLASGAPLLLYGYAAAGENEKTGVLYMCPSGFSATSLKSVSANLSSEGTELQIVLPWGSNQTSVMKITSGFSEKPDSSYTTGIIRAGESMNLIGGLRNMFGEGTMTSSRVSEKSDSSYTGSVRAGDAMNLIGGLRNMFGEGTMTASELQVALPLSKNSNRIIEKPKLIHSEDGTGSVFIHFQLQE